MAVENMQGDAKPLLRCQSVLHLYEAQTIDDRWWAEVSGEDFCGFEGRILVFIPLRAEMSL
jgi:hypothetical protein